MFTPALKACNVMFGGFISSYSSHWSACCILWQSFQVHCCRFTPKSLTLTFILHSHVVLPLARHLHCFLFPRHCSVCNANCGQFNRICFVGKPDCHFWLKFWGWHQLHLYKHNKLCVNRHCSRCLSQRPHLERWKNRARC